MNCRKVSAGRKKAFLGYGGDIPVPDYTTCVYTVDFGVVLQKDKREGKFFLDFTNFTEVVNYYIAPHIKGVILRDKFQPKAVVQPGIYRYKTAIGSVKLLNNIRGELFFCVWAEGPNGLKYVPALYSMIKSGFLQPAQE